MKKQNTKHSLIMSAIALLLCFSMLLGTTFAWFTDSVTSSNNKIQAGNLKIDLELLDKTNGWASIKESKAPIFNYNNWEPGYTDVKVLKIENEGSLALKWMARFVSADALTALANVIDVYVCPSATALAYPTGRDLTGYTKVGTVAEFVNTIEDTTNGTLLSGESAYLGIALKMQETAGNEYQNAEIKPFDIQIVATQQNYEEDSFDATYDQFAEYEGNQPQTPAFTVYTAAELQAAMTPTVSNGDLVVNIASDIELAAGETWTPLNLNSYTGVARVIINGNNHTIKGLNGTLIDSAIFGNTKVEINDLTLSNSKVISSGDYAGAFVSYSDNAIAVQLKNCHVIDSTIKSNDYAGGLVGYVSGTIDLVNCSAAGCNITGGGSVGALVGMISTAQGGETATVSNVTVTGNTLVSTKAGTYRVGELIGASNIATLNLSGVNASNNTCTQDGSTGPTSGMSSSEWIGRYSNNVTGDTSAKKF